MRAIDEFKQMDGRAITFVGGGEPTLHPRAPLVFDHAAKVGIKFGLISHFARSYSEEMYNSLKRATWIRVSINAATPETYGRIQGCSPEAFYVMDKNIRRLVRLEGPKVGISFLVHPMNVNEIFRATVLAKQAGVHFIQYKPCILPEKKVAFEPHLSEIQSQLDEAKRLEFSGFQVLDQFTNRLNEAELSWKKMVSGKCWVPHLNPKLAGDGSIYVCCERSYSKDAVLGDFRTTSLKDIFSSDRARAVVESIEMMNCPLCWERSVNSRINNNEPLNMPSNSEDEEFV